MALDALENHFFTTRIDSDQTAIFSRCSIAVAPPGLTTHLKLPEGTPEISDWGRDSAISRRNHGLLFEYCTVPKVIFE